MNETPKNVEEAGDAFDLLYKELITDEIKGSDFLDTVLERDQSDPERQSAMRATEILTKPDVVELFVGTPQEIKFYSVRSLSFFHQAQIRLSKGESDVEDDLKASLSDSLMLGEQDIDWSNYVRATIAYLQNDSDGIKKLVDNIDANNSLVRNFITGLEERGYPDYVTDYSKPRE